MEKFTMEVINVIAIIVAGLMVGSELAIARLFIQHSINFRMMFIW
jgi:hypothetical protein